MKHGAADVLPEKAAQSSALGWAHTKKLKAAPLTCYLYHTRFGNQDWMRQFRDECQDGADLQGVGALETASSFREIRQESCSRLAYALPA